MTDSYTWRALYSDGSALPEYDEEAPEGRGFKHIDLSRLSLLQYEAPDRPTVAVAIGDAMRPILFRRRQMLVAPGPQGNYDGEPLGKTTVHVLGFQTTARGKNVSAYLWLFEDGSILLSDNPDSI